MKQKSDGIAGLQALGKVTKTGPSLGTTAEPRCPHLGPLLRGFIVVDTVLAFGTPRLGNGSSAGPSGPEPQKSPTAHTP